MSKKDTVEWLVIGAGPAGIASIGKLLDHEIPPHQIGWLDPAFQVGDLGMKWRNVPSNTKVRLFLKFLYGCDSFKYAERKKSFPIDLLNPKDTCLLKEIATPLQWITDNLKEQVRVFQDEALALNLLHGHWEVKARASTLFAKNVILAIGADPKVLSYSHPPSIPVDHALDQKKLAHHIQPGDVVGVFGSSHSAVLILANLMQLDLKMVYNFYRSPHFYAIDLEEWILFDDSGLKGFAANWARQYLDGEQPPKLKRLQVSDHAYEEVLSLCNKVIYAVGFERRKLPVLEQFEGAAYNEATGIIAPGLFGIGIAFPQVHFDRLGNLEYRVGLWKFMDYLNTILPIWLKYGKNVFAATAQ